MKKDQRFLLEPRGPLRESTSSRWLGVGLVDDVEEGVEGKREMSRKKKGKLG